MAAEILDFSFFFNSDSCNNMPVHFVLMCLELNKPVFLSFLTKLASRWGQCRLGNRISTISIVYNILQKVTRKFNLFQNCSCLFIREHLLPIQTCITKAKLASDHKFIFQTYNDLYHTGVHIYTKYAATFYLKFQINLSNKNKKTKSRCQNVSSIAS